MIEKALVSLGYTSKWLDYGLLDPAELEAQFRAFLAGEDTNTEHYRFASFRRILTGGPLSDTRVEQFLELATLDPDRVMATSALYELCSYLPLTERQLDLAAEHRYLRADPRPVLRRRERNAKK